MKAKEISLSFSLVLLVAFSSTFSNAETVTYSFEPPQLVFGQSTPLFNIVPDVGPSSFLASFTAPTGGSFSINNFRVNPSFTGQNLLDPAYPDATLRVTLNTPITDVQLDFELALSSGHLRFQCSSGTTNFNAVPSTQYGSLVFHSPVPITQFDLSGFNSSNTGTFFAIDNLVMTFVPEPSTFALFIAGISVVAFRYVRCKRGCT